jgi:YD repeat-containing protein
VVLTGFSVGSQVYGSYEMQYGDGSKKIFSGSDGSTGTSRKIFLKRIVDPDGNFVELTYDSNLRIVAITDPIGQVTTLSYDNTSDICKILGLRALLDPFGSRDQIRTRQLAPVSCGGGPLTVTRFEGCRCGGA